MHLEYEYTALILWKRFTNNHKTLWGGYMSIKLPITKPPIISYQVLAFPLSILFSFQEFLPWFYSNYIQLVCYDNDFNLNDIGFNFFKKDMYSDYPCMKVKGIPISKVDKYFNYLHCNSVRDFIKLCIRNQYYILTYVNKRYIPGTEAYMKYDFNHDTFVYGYNDDENLVYLLGFDNSHTFREMSVSFDDFIMAYTSCKHYPDNRFILYKKKSKVDCQLDIVDIYHSIQDFLLSRNSLARYNPNNPTSIPFQWGMNTYLHLKKYLLYLSAKGMHADIRPFTVIREHKKCMCLRIKYLYDHGYIHDNLCMEKYDELSDISNLILSLAIKYNVTLQTPLIDKILGKIDKIRDLEETVLAAMANDLLYFFKNQL